MNNVSIKLLLWLVLTFLVGRNVALAIDEDPLMVVHPKPTDELLANPGMGWETFHEFTSKTDPSLPSWIPSTVHYVRWGWIELEPQPGQLNTNLIDSALKAAHDAGQKLAFRVKTCSPNSDMPNTPAKTVRFHPLWLKQAGGRELLVDYDGSAPNIPIPDFDDPDTLKLHLDFIRRLGEHYDGHPDLDHVDLGSLGWWGEWHLSRSKLGKMPSQENCQKIVDAYLAAFKKTPLIMLLNGKELTTYATQHGAGWRIDSLGDLGTFSTNENHMLNRYPQWFAQTKVQDVWKTAPIAFEPPATVAEFVEKKWPLRWIFNYGLALHGSYFNGKSSPLPQDANLQRELTRFLCRLGYRIVLDEVSHPAEAKAGIRLVITSKWQNVGSAPCYQPYRVAYRLSNNHGFEKILVTSTTVNHWLPGTIDLFTEEFFKMPQDLPPGPVNQTSDSLALPATIQAGEYALSVGVVGVSNQMPIVKLAINGRANDGWYPLSKIRIVTSSLPEAATASRLPSATPNE